MEKGATYALGVDTRLDDMSVSLLRGRVVMDGLHVSNPEGFTSPHLMQTGRFDLEVRTGSLLSDTIEVGKFELDGLDLNVEQKLTSSNVSKVIENVRRLGGDSGAEPPEGEGKKVKVDRIVIKNLVAHFHLLPGVVASGPRTVKLPDLELKEVSTEGDGASIPRLVARILPAILKAAIRQGQDVVPGEFLRGLDVEVGGLAEALGGPAEDLVAQVGGQLAERLGPQAGKAVDALRKAAGEGVGGVVGDLLKGKKQPEDKR